MAIAPTPPRTGTVDPETGRLLPLTAEERAARSEAMARVFGELIPADENETDERWAEVFRGIDQARPHRPLFEGMY